MDESIAELRKICQEPRLGDPRMPWYSEHVIRRLSIYVTRVLLPTGVTANQVTILSGASGLVAAVLFAFGSYPRSVTAAGLIFCMELLDHVDGEVARYRQTASLKGKCWDSWVPFIVMPLVLGGISFGVYNTAQNVGAFVLGYIAALSQALLYTAEFTRLELTRSGAKKAVSDATRVWPSVAARLYGLIEWAHAASRRMMRISPILTMGIQLGAIFNVLPAVLCMFALVLPCELAYQLLRIQLDFE